MVRRKGRGRKEASLAELLVSSPWQVSVGAGGVVLVVLKWILPALAAGNMFLKPISAAASSAAWLFAGAFFLLGGIAFVKKAAPGSRRVAEPAAHERLDATPVEQQPSWHKWAGVTSPNPDLPRGALREPVDKAAEPGTPTAWSLDLIRDLEWKRFEDVCQQFYERKGIRSETTPLGPDGGIDIRLYQDDTGHPTSIVQCKAWGERLVGVKPVRELLGVMTHEKIGKAFFMTSGSYSEDAKAIAQANRITLIDGNMLLMMIQRLPVEERDGLLAFATSGDYTTPTCPSCGVKMKAIEGKGGRPDFWGCRDYPRCRQKLGMRRMSPA